MPQVVACGQCRQQFAAADFLVGTTVACPTCGAALVIPQLAAAAATVASPPARLSQPARFVQSAAPPIPAAAGAQPSRAASQPAPAAAMTLGAHIDDLARYLPPQFRRRDRAIGLAILVLVAAIWFLAVAPTLPLVLGWARRGFGGHDPLNQMLARTWGISAVFWIGMVIAAAGIFEWSFFMNSYKMQVTREWFGDRGARWFLVGTGGVLAAMGLAFIIVPMLFGWMMMARHAVAGPAVPRPWVAPPAPPPEAFRPPDRALQALRADLPSDPFASAAVLPVAAADAGQDPANLHGSWRRLEGGLGIKIPAVLLVMKESVRREHGGLRQELHGRTREGKDGVTFNLVLELAPGRNHQSDGYAVLANGLVLHRSDRIGAVTETYNDETFRHRGIRHQYNSGPLQVTIDVGSRFEPDHPEVQALAEYARTLQPLAPAAGEEPGIVSSGRWQGRWRALPGGLCILVPSSLLIEEDSREGAIAGDGKQTINGTTASGMEYRLTARYTARDNVRNFARQTEVHMADFDMEPVTLAGMVFTRTSRAGRGPAEVSYQLMEGPYHISLRITSRGEPTDEFRSLAAYAETIQRAGE
jgi:hypothetical protein